MINNDLAVDNPRGGSFCPLFPGRIRIWNVGFSGRRKSGKTLRARTNQQQTQVQESNPGHSSGGRAHKVCSDFYDRSSRRFAMRLDLHGSRLIEAEVEGSLFCLQSSWAF